MDRKGKEEYLYSTFLHQGTHKVLRHGSHSFTCKQHHACLSFMSIHQMAPPQQLWQQTSNCNLLLIYRPRKDERLSWPGWLTCSGWFTHLSGHPSATDRAQDSESTPTKDWRSTAGPHNQHYGCLACLKNIEILLCATVFIAIEAATWSDENLSEEDKHSAGEGSCYCEKGSEQWKQTVWTMISVFV